MHGTKGTFYFVACLTYSNVDTLLPFCNFMSSCSFMHDTTFEFHTFEGFFVEGVLQRSHIIFYTKRNLHLVSMMQTRCRFRYMFNISASVNVADTALLLQSTSHRNKSCIWKVRPKSTYTPVDIIG